MKILLAITFVYGVITLLECTRLFKESKSLPTFSITTNSKNLTFVILAIKYSFFYFCLIFQSWYWLFK